MKFKKEGSFRSALSKFLDVNVTDIKGSSHIYKYMKDEYYVFDEENLYSFIKDSTKDLVNDLLKDPLLGNENTRKFYAIIQSSLNNSDSSYDDTMQKLIKKYGSQPFMRLEEHIIYHEGSLFYIYKIDY